MPAFYTYFIASLPMLHFGDKPPFSYKAFLAMCERFISKEDLRILNTLPLREDGAAIKNKFIRRWLDFDTALRNELVRARARHRRLDPTKYLRPEKEPPDAALAHLAISSHRNPSPLEAEKILDRARWDMLDSLEMGHYFDCEYLIVYAYKLELLERWERINTADKNMLISTMLSKN